jgi:hypothetical protein
MNKRLPISDIWVYLSGDPLFALIITLATYQLGYLLYVRAKRNPLVNPVAISVILTCLAIDVLDMPYEKYFEGAQFVHFLLGTATVALAVPIYHGFKRMQGKIFHIWVALSPLPVQWPLPNSWGQLTTLSEACTPSQSRPRLPWALPSA